MLLPAFTLVQAGAAEWSRFRGPNGSSVAADAKPPVQPGADNLAWQAPLPPGLSSPVIAGGRVFLTGLENGRLVTLAFDAASGRELWRREAPEVALEPVHAINSPATPTPCADSGRVYLYFGSFGLLCCDRDGKELWQKPIPTRRASLDRRRRPFSMAII